jgi:hypothetical protein
MFSERIFWCPATPDGGFCDADTGAPTPTAVGRFPLWFEVELVSRNSRHELQKLRSSRGHDSGRFR